MQISDLWVAGITLLALCGAGCGGSSDSFQQEMLLLQRTLGDDGGTQLPGVSLYKAALGVETQPGSSSYVEVFEDDVLSPAAQGTSFVTVEADDVEFPQLVGLLTNGADDVLRLLLDRDIGGSVVAGFPESQYEYAVARTGPDLYGYTITRFELHVVELRYEVPGADPNGDGNWQSRFVEIRFEVYGTR